MRGNKLEEHKSTRGKFAKKAAAKKAKMKETVAQAKALLAEAKTPEEVQAKVPEKGRRGRGRGQLTLEVQGKSSGDGQLPAEVQGQGRRRGRGMGAVARGGGQRQGAVA